ncbi:uncharacterized protein BCR38DRAFT_136724 [Pseudomassariella vexata]|uniref:Uncharacterized protein n=1 Tax=Pseudomassariella vexata TaxID=1141098 RepID=A0A1Y2EAU4_9PEZI|nr:uncharacterized protein BCR38DRAFT_136724 [Pseudomassariella vexata]ORY68693.1 hypothetical protein BCR38DRAFT_136724 [Pseudomassariella vexata]
MYDPRYKAENDHKPASTLFERGLDHQAESTRLDRYIRTNRSRDDGTLSTFSNRSTSQTGYDQGAARELCAVRTCQAHSWNAKAMKVANHVKALSAAVRGPLAAGLHKTVKTVLLPTLLYGSEVCYKNRTKLTSRNAKGREKPVSIRLGGGRGAATSCDAREHWSRPSGGYCQYGKRQLVMPCSGPADYPRRRWRLKRRDTDTPADYRRCMTSHTPHGGRGRRPKNFLLLLYRGLIQLLRALRSTVGCYTPIVLLQLAGADLGDSPVQRCAAARSLLMRLVATTLRLPIPLVH